jgi:Na+-translocating ferredoxin:NAD+ oxidoreductase RnfD subunit
MYLMLFLIGLPGQLLFGVTTMTMAAVVTTYLFGLAYFAVTGIYFFVDSYIPIAVFLGMHLLFTDPSTSPRTELGRLFFGAMYGLGTVAAYALLGRAGLPTYYDKLLPVPMLNLLVKLIDRGASSRVLGTIAPERIGPSLTLLRRNLLYISV